MMQEDGRYSVCRWILMSDGICCESHVLLDNLLHVLEDVFQSLSLSSFFMFSVRVRRFFFLADHHTSCVSSC